MKLVFSHAAADCMLNSCVLQHSQDLSRKVCLAPSDNLAKLLHERSKEPAQAGTYLPCTS